MSSYAEICDHVEAQLGQRIAKYTGMSPEAADIISATVRLLMDACINKTRFEALEACGAFGAKENPK